MTVEALMLARSRIKLGNGFSKEYSEQAGKLNILNALITARKFGCAFRQGGGMVSYSELVALAKKKNLV